VVIFSSSSVDCISWWSTDEEKMKKEKLTGRDLKDNRFSASKTIHYIHLDAAVVQVSMPV
jgi:hypothetical protein